MKSILLTALILAGCASGEAPEAQIAPVQAVPVVERTPEPSPEPAPIQPPDGMVYCAQSNGCPESPAPYKPRK